MKTRSTLTDRAARIRSDYAPLAAPPNPRADEAQAALVEYGRGMLQNAPVETDLQLNDEAVELLERALEKHGELTDEAKISAALAHWPNMQPYAASARIETLTTTLPGDVLARGEVVTVTCFEKKGERE